LQRALAIDYLFVDTHPGVNEETLLSIGFSDTLVIALRADHHDYQGITVTIDLARQLETPQILMVVDRVLQPFDARLANSLVVRLIHLTHPVSEGFRSVAEIE